MIDEIIREIESPEFRYFGDIASGERIFVRLLAESKAFADLKDALKSPANEAAVLRRIAYLAEAEVDARYENPWDVAITAYVVAMIHTNSTLGRLAMVAARRAQNSWWLTHVVSEAKVLPVSVQRIGKQPACSTPVFLRSFGAPALHKSGYQVLSTWISRQHVRPSYDQRIDVDPFAKLLVGAIFHVMPKATDTFAWSEGMTGSSEYRPRDRSFNQDLVLH